MADENFGTDPLESPAEAEEPTAVIEGEQADMTQNPGDTPDLLRDANGNGPVDPNDPQYKYWQGAYTKTRQNERRQIDEKYGQIEAQHQQYGDVLRNFATSDPYALQVFRERFPGAQIIMPGERGTQSQQALNTPARGQSSPVVQMLEQNLGDDLAFLAPRLGPVIEQVIQASLQAGLAPIEQRTRQQQEDARKQAEAEVMGQMDSQYPGWEARYSQDMQDLDAFLASGSLKHPRWGSKKELLYKLANPDHARVDAVRSIGQAARSRVGTGRTAPQTQPDPTKDILAAKTNSDAFRLAAEAAMRELGRSA